MNKDGADISNSVFMGHAWMGQNMSIKTVGVSGYARKKHSCVTTLRQSMLCLISEQGKDVKNTSTTHVQFTCTINYLCSACGCVKGHCLPHREVSILGIVNRNEEKSFSAFLKIADARNYSQIKLFRSFGASPILRNIYGMNDGK